MNFPPGIPTNAQTLMTSGTTVARCREDLRLYYLGPPGDGFGWGVANTNLVKALSKLCNVVVDTTARTTFDAPVFVPVIDSQLKPMRKVKAPRLLGYCFTEWPIPEDAHREARQYDVLFAGSTWNAERLKEAGCKRVDVLIQGVDCERFKPIPNPTSGKHFVVFSGGKFEFRKGQDYVIRAMQLFMKFRKDVKLLTSWHNPWPQSVQSMQNSWLIDMQNPLEGIPADRVIQCPPTPNEKLPDVYALADIGVFPNRCEAGTNLVMCEFMACGKPVIATYATGQIDALTWPAYLLTNGDYDHAGWFNPPVADIIAALEHAYHHRDELPIRGQGCRKLAERLSWDDCARKIFLAAFPEEQGKDRGTQSLALASQ